MNEIIMLPMVVVRIQKAVTGKFVMPKFKVMTIQLIEFTGNI